MKSTPIVPAPSATSKDMTILETFYDVSKGKTELASECQLFLERGDRPIVVTLGSAFLSGKCPICDLTQRSNKVEHEV